MVADVDGDGISGSAFHAGRANAGGRPRRPDGGFDARSLPVYTHWVDVGDLNGDGRPDMATVSGDPRDVDDGQRRFHLRLWKSTAFWASVPQSSQAVT